MILSRIVLKMLIVRLGPLITLRVKQASTLLLPEPLLNQVARLATRAATVLKGLDKQAATQATIKIHRDKPLAKLHRKDDFQEVEPPQAMSVMQESILEKQPGNATHALQVRSVETKRKLHVPSVLTQLKELVTALLVRVGPCVTRLDKLNLSPAPLASPVLEVPQIPWLYQQLPIQSEGKVHRKRAHKSAIVVTLVPTQELLALTTHPVRLAHGQTLTRQLAQILEMASIPFEQPHPKLNALRDFTVINLRTIAPSLVLKVHSALQLG